MHSHWSAWAFSPRDWNELTRRQHAFYCRLWRHSQSRCPTQGMGWMCALTLDRVVHSNSYCKYNAVNFLKNIHKTPHSSPVRARYRVSIVDPASDWYSPWVPAIIYAISYCIGPCYNGTRLNSTLREITWDLGDHFEWYILVQKPIPKSSIARAIWRGKIYNDVTSAPWRPKLPAYGLFVQ